MTGKADFSEQDWRVLTEAPALVGTMVATAERGGTFSEAVSMGKAYAEARRRHGNSELLDELVSSRPKMEHERYHSPEELREHVLERLREAVRMLRAKASEQEVEDYAGFVRSVAEHVAHAHSEGGQEVSAAERAAIDAIDAALAAPASPAG